MVGDVVGATLVTTTFIAPFDAKSFCYIFYLVITLACCLLIFTIPKLSVVSHVCKFLW
jgi:hypothetical protein